MKKILAPLLLVVLPVAAGIASGPSDQTDSHAPSFFTPDEALPGFAFQQLLFGSVATFDQLDRVLVRTDGPQTFPADFLPVLENFVAARLAFEPLFLAFQHEIVTSSGATNFDRFATFENAHTAFGQLRSSFSSLETFFLDFNGDTSAFEAGFQDLVHSTKVFFFAFESFASFFDHGFANFNEPEAGFRND